MAILDALTGVMQSLLIGYMITYCIEEEKRDKTKIAILIIGLIIVSSSFVTGTFQHNNSLGVFISHLGGMLLTYLLYRKKAIEAITTYTIIYLLICIFNLIFANLIFEFIKNILPERYNNYEIIIIVYVSSWILIALSFKYAHIIKNVYKTIIREKFTLVIINISLFADFIMTFYILNLREKSQLMINILEILFFIFIVMILLHFNKINVKSKEIFKLNECLEIKNKELSKIKHDYGAQISYLYGLCLMKRDEDLKSSLKNIINSNNSTLSGVEINENNNSLLSLVLKPALQKGIHVIIKSECDIRLCKIPEIDLYRVLSNIVDNAIIAMEGKGIINAIAYEQEEMIVIKLQNNGPKIQEELMDKIFKVGFTTKKDKKVEHGFGLSKAKELIERNNGKIYLKSTEIVTQFKIILPIRKIKKTVNVI